MSEKCLCKKAYEEIDMYYLMSLNEAKGTLQIFKNRGNGNFGMLFTEYQYHIVLNVAES